MELRGMNDRIKKLRKQSEETTPHIFMERAMLMTDAYKKYEGEVSIPVSYTHLNRTLTIRDNGLGMNKDELEDNLGTIAKSGSLAFKQEMEEAEKNDDVDIIGQFGVGFYSAFMVASRVEVTTKKYGEETAYLWSSNAVDGYSIDECEKDEHGTQIVLYLKDNTEDENYDEYLQQYEIERLIKKYSDYIRYPIEMWVESSKRVEDAEGENEDTDKRAEPKYETVKELKTLNSMIPLWKRNKSEITKEEYDEFYKSKFNDYTEPQKVIHTSVELSLIHI